jgi:Predicted membrane protein (DUF2207)
MAANVLLPVLVAVVPALGYLGVCALTAARTNRPVQPGPPAFDLGPEPPAVVNLLVHRGDLTEDAAEATLLDLAARRLLELRGLGPDPRRTTVHLSGPPPAGLARYERLVYDHVAERAVDGVVPLTALGFRDPRQAIGWLRRLKAAVAEEAKSTGLAGYRLSGTSGLLLVFGSIPAAGACWFGTALFGARETGDSTLGARVGVGACLAFVLWLVLFYTGMFMSRRGITPYGRQRAAYWLGVREWLTAHPNFADLPPSATAVWDRYLAYGAALGTTRTASAAIDLGTNRRV